MRCFRNDRVQHRWPHRLRRVRTIDKRQATRDPADEFPFRRGSEGGVTTVGGDRDTAARYQILRPGRVMTEAHTTTSKRALTFVSGELGGVAAGLAAGIAVVATLVVI